MGCQTEIAETIIDAGGHYLLAVKENQPTLYDDIVRAFDDALDSLPRALDQRPPLKVETWTEINKGHGRIEERDIHVCHDLSWLTTGERWEELAFIAMITSRRTELSTDKTTVEKRYYIGSRTGAAPSLVAKRIRDHRGIENSLHC
ncbi:MAG: ISAs1 family transposase [Bradymonadaceae bacterium]